jgi:broad specificity phosphatase PhoE
MCVSWTARAGTAATTRKEPDACTTCAVPRARDVMASKGLPLFADVPASLTLVRHAESQGNIADRRARSARAEQLELDVRDADVDLSENGLDQAEVLGRWFDSLTSDSRPTRVLSSPYRRALHTATRTVGETGLDIVVDERLRERDLGLFDGLTGHGIRQRYVEEARRRKRIGEFYYRPPQGESWADVVLRVRSLLADLRSGFGDARIWLFSHQAVIMSFRYVLEYLGEQELLELDNRVTLGNASVTTYERRGAALELVRFADDSTVREGESAATREPSVEDVGRVAR